MLSNQFQCPATECCCKTDNTIYCYKHAKKIFCASHLFSNMMKRTKKTGSMQMFFFFNRTNLSMLFICFRQ